MAVTRKNSDMPEMLVTEDEIMEALKEFGATEANPMPIKDIATAVADTIEAVWKVLDTMETEGKADLVGPYKNSAWWPLSEASKAKPQKPAKRTRRTKAEMDAARAEENERNKYAAKAAESQDAVLSQAPQSEPKCTNCAADLGDCTCGKNESASSKIFKPAPDALPKGTKITLESGAEATVIADEVVRVKVPSEVERLTRLIQTLTDEHAEASNVRDGYEAPEEVTSLPERPQGVNENVWNAVHNAYGVSHRDTLSAQLFYAKRALEQHTAAIA